MADVVVSTYDAKEAVDTLLNEGKCARACVVWRGNTTLAPLLLHTCSRILFDFFFKKRKKKGGEEGCAYTQHANASGWPTGPLSPSFLIDSARSYAFDCVLGAF